ncbi:cysteine synthase A [Pseudomaricurvus alkylphenolicus]|nr:cysteine synthase A [Pseudomaricurvus alkylphenolicus]
MARYNNILETIGNTPLVRLNKLAPEGVNLYVKIEAFNPMGSVKDRMARAVIEQAEQSGELKPGMTVIEATSGNTGIGLAMVCAQKGYPLVVTMAENFSVERRKLLRFLGAKVVLTPAAEKGTGMLNKASELAQTHGYYLCRQFENEVNADVHSRTTAREILADFAGERLDYWVTGSGTGGTLKGVSRTLKSESPVTKIVVAEPDNAPVLASGIAQPRAEDGSPSASHPNFRPHLMQGWSPDFISKLTEDAISGEHVDEIVPVAGSESIELSQRLAREEGIFCGITSGATLAAALQVARRSDAGTNIVCMLPDTGERYLSTPLFADIKEEMSQEEIAISQSTPGYQFVSLDTPQVAGSRELAEVDGAAQAHVEKLLQQQSVVMFALEWCEFCWAVRKLFQAMQLDYHSADLDSVAYQDNDMGGKVRPVLLNITGQPTIPQIFIAGECVGGSSELFAEYESGALIKRLQRHGIAFNADANIDLNAMMPQWVQPRQSA